MDEISLEEFLSHWDVSRADLANVCECSVATVNHWFIDGPNRREPTARHRRRLADAHRQFLQWKAEATRYRSIYDRQPPNPI